MTDPDLTLLDGVRCGDVPVPGDRSHALLACLALAAPRTVGVPHLIEQVWPEDEPDHPEKALQVLVSRTRTRTSAETVVHEGSGYRLGLRDDQVDALRLRRLLSSAEAAKEAGDLDVVRHAARDALALPITSAPPAGPLADLVRAARRDHDRARRLLGGVLLARGDAAGALALLEPALAEDPRDEGVLGDVLRAEAEARGIPTALARYAAHAERTLDEVGAEPGEVLRRLHLELLARDAPVREGLKYDATPMVGRDEVVSDLRSLLSRSRVVSLVGAGGLGKTRTAHLVGRLAQQPVVHFVELAGVNAPEGVLPEVATALGVRESTTLRAGQRSTDLRSRLAEQLSGPPTLLILDNCEHVIGAVADLVAFLVATTAGTTVLTTSRATLGIAAEQVYLLPQLDDSEAAELFAQRARQARTGVRLDPAEVHALVSRLDGLPLAIELAAAKVRAMSVADITRRLSDRFALLAGSDRSAPDRHRTLEAVIDWSWNLLPEDDRAALRTLAVFPDGFSFDGAETVLGRDPLSALTELVDQSLLVVREGESLRYRFLETVREYGLKQLAANGEEVTVRAKLREWGVATARSLQPQLHTVEQVAVMQDIRSEAGNLAGLLRTAIADEDVETVVPLVGLLSAFWTIEGEHLTVMSLAGPVLELLLADGGAGFDEQELSSAMALLMMNEFFLRGPARPDAIATLAKLDRSGPDAGIAGLLVKLFEDGSALDVARLTELTRDPDVRIRRTALQWLSQVSENAGDMHGALEAGRKALALCDELPAEGPWMRALIESQLSGHASQLGDWDLCVELAGSALLTMEALGATDDALQLRSVLALADLGQGRIEQARAAFERIAAYDHGDKTFGWSVGLVGQAELALADLDVDTGLALYRRCIEIAASRRLDAYVVAELGPWTLYAESSALFATVFYGRRADAADLAESLRDKLVRLMSQEPDQVDYPITGCVLLALGAYDLTGEAPVDQAVSALALAQRFAYQRTLPTMAWKNVQRLTEPRAPGLLTTLVASYEDRLPAQLHEEAVTSVGGQTSLR